MAHIKNIIKPITITVKRPSKKLLHNGNFITLNPKIPMCNWVLIEDGKISGFGKNNAPVVLGKIEKVNLKKAWVTPGLEDTHVHFNYIGELKSKIDLTGINSKQKTIREILNKIMYIKKDIIVGRGWNSNIWSDKSITYKDLPPTNKPMILHRIDAHAMLVNKKVLEICDINKNTKEVIGGKIEKDKYGEPTGILIDNAMNIVNEQFKFNVEETLIEDYLNADREFIKNGIVKIHDMGIDSVRHKILKKLYENKKLKVKTYAYYNSKENVPFYKSEEYEIAGIKIFIDGSFGSKSALLKNNYKNSNSNGLQTLTQEELETYIKFSIKNNHQLAVHAIGDGAMKILGKTFKKYKNEIKGRRFRVEHAAMLDPSDMKYFNNLDLIFSIQPCHYTSDIKWLKNTLTKEDMLKVYPWRNLKSLNKVITVGTDSPIEPITPLRNFQVKRGLNPLDILKGYTVNAAIASFKEETRGKIDIDYDSDFTFFSDNPLKKDFDILGVIIGSCEV